MADGYSGQEHSLPILPLYKDVVEFVARTKTFYTPTILVAYGAPWSENYYFESENTNGDAKLRRWVPEELLDTMIRRRPQWFIPEEYGHTKIGKQVADIVHAGGRAALGSHGQLQGLGAHWETWNLGSGGLTPHETLRVVTLYGAEAIGMQQDVGSLEAGKMADLIVLDRNPLENIRNTNSIRFVMKNGELYEGDTLNMVWPETRPMLRPFWADFAPASNAACKAMAACARGKASLLLASRLQRSAAGLRVRRRPTPAYDDADALRPVQSSSASTMRRRAPHFLAVDLEVRDLDGGRGPVALKRPLLAPDASPDPRAGTAAPRAAEPLPTPPGRTPGARAPRRRRDAAGSRRPECGAASAGRRPPPSSRRRPLLPPPRAPPPLRSLRLHRPRRPAATPGRCGAEASRHAR